MKRDSQVRRTAPVLVPTPAERGYTYDELAARSGLSRRTLIEIEQGRTIGSLATWHAIAHALQAPLDRLFATLCTGHRPPGP